MIRASALLLLGLSCGVVWAQAPAKSGTPPKSTTQPDTRSDYLRSESVKAPEARPDSGVRLNINKASERELAKLPGVGEAGAKAIIKRRPYRSKEELVTKKVLPQNVYEDVKTNVYVGH